MISKVRTTFVLFFLIAGSVQAASLQEADSRQIQRVPLGIGFDRFSTTDKLGRSIIFYLSHSPNATAKLPLIVFVQGSGCDSNFQKCGQNVCGGIQNVFLSAAGRGALILVVEKPGVQYLDSSSQPGTAAGCSTEFLQVHTLERWSQAVASAIRAARSLPEVDGTRTLVVGMSEGGLVAARVSAEDNTITHVASLSGGGPTQLFEFIASALGTPSPGTDPSSKINSVYGTWNDISNDPNSATKFFAGHPYRRWSSFMKTSVMAEMLRSNAKVFLAQGTADPVESIAGFDMLVAELKSRGRDVTSLRLDGAGHNLGKDASDMAGLTSTAKAVVDWFLSDRSSKPLNQD